MAYLSPRRAARVWPAALLLFAAALAPVCAQQNGYAGTPNWTAPLNGCLTPAGCLNGRPGGGHTWFKFSWDPGHRWSGAVPGALREIGVLRARLRQRKKRRMLAHPEMEYLGGPILSRAKIVAVYLNDPDGERVPFADQMTSFYRTIAAGPYLSWLAQYRGAAGAAIAPGELEKAVSVEWTPPSAARTPDQDDGALSDSQIRRELSALISSGAAPAPDAQTLYLLHFSPGTEISGPTGGLSCRDWCAYHSSFKSGASSVYYAVIPFQGGGCRNLCGPALLDSFDDTTRIASREMLDAVGDPEAGAAQSGAGNAALGFVDPRTGLELGGACQDSPYSHDRVSGYEVQTGWSARDNACVTGSAP